MSIKIGNKNVVNNFSLMVPKGEDAWIDFVVDDWSIRLHVVFVSDVNSKKNVFTLTPKGDHAEMSFTNWNQSITAALVDYVKIGQSNKGREVFMLATGLSIEGFNKFDFIFLTKGEK